MAKVFMVERRKEIRVTPGNTVVVIDTSGKGVGTVTVVFDGIEFVDIEERKLLYYPTNSTPDIEKKFGTSVFKVRL